MHKRFILLLGLFLASHVLTQDRIAPIMTIVPTVRVPLLTASFLLPDNPGKSAPHFSYLFAGAYEPNQGLDDPKNLSPMHEVKTLILTQSLLPLAQLWDGRMRLDGFTSTLHVQLGPSAGGRVQDFRSPRQS